MDASPNTAWSRPGGLPSIVRLPIASVLSGTGMDIIDAGIGLVERVQSVARIGDPGAVAVSHGIFRDDFEVALLNEIVQRLRRFLLVHGVGINGSAHHVQVFLEDSFAGAP